MGGCGVQSLFIDSSEFFLLCVCPQKRSPSFAAYMLVKSDIL